MDLAIVIALNVGYAIASLVLMSIGLAVIFGMMRVINLAHGEFLMLGAYTAVTFTVAGVNVWISMLVLAPLVVGAIGFVVERLLIRWLYGRMIDTMLATWGLSLFLIGLITTIFGATTQGVSAPIGSIAIGDQSYSGYNVFLIFMAALLLIGGYLVMRYSKAGLIARGTMQNSDVAAGLGVNRSLVYSTTFTVGAALSGLAGGLLAPLATIKPTMGIAYIAKAFITVIGGGPAILTGSLTASGLFGGISRAVEYMFTTVYGEIALLVVAVVMLRFLPQGITGRLFRGAP